jgi:hypothetical protein
MICTSLIEEYITIECYKRTKDIDFLHINYTDKS